VMVLTDKRAVRVALDIAIESEKNLIDCYHGNREEEAVQDAEKNIAAFRRVIKRHYNEPGKTFKELMLDGTETVDIYDIKKEPLNADK
jgi:hypothetical protein